MTKAGFKKRYLERFTRYPKQTTSTPEPDTFLSIIIPCLNESEVIKTLESLKQCHKPEKPVEVLVALNHSRDAPDEIVNYNRETYFSIQEWADKNNSHALRVIPLWYPDIKPKIAGVGTARKLGMDEAVYRFYEINQPKGVMVCLDADCSVEPNYLQALENHFIENPATSGCAIYFEHPLDRVENEHIYKAILDFELYLRYYKNALLWCGFPYAYHTIGSVMAVPCDVYQKVGGMNKQIAGEDFYFLQKVIYQGSFTTLNKTCVYPSPRKSLRVPFGTGQAVTDFIEEEKGTLKVFNPASYMDFKEFVKKVPMFWNHTHKQEAHFNALPESIQEFLKHYDFPYYLKESIVHASDEETFLKRFFHWFNAFMALKYLHFSRDHFHPNVPVKEAVQWLNKELKLEQPEGDKKTLLQNLRDFDQNSEPKDYLSVKF